MNDKGFNVVAFNRTVEKVDRFLANEAKGMLAILRTWLRTYGAKALTLHRT